jgi:O-antigen/teichoic acid export membrane protein
VSTLRILRNTAWNLAGQGIPVFAALVAIPLLIQGLGESRFGILALGWLVTGYFALFDLGVGRSAIRQMVAHGVAPSERRADVFRTSLVLHALLGLLGGVLLGILAPWLASTALAIPVALATEAEYAFLWLAASVPALVLASAYRAALEADQRFDLVNAVRLPASVANFVMPLAILPLTSRVDLVIAVIVGTRWMVLLAYYMLVAWAVTGLRPGRFDRMLATTLLREGGWMTVSTLVAPLILAADRLAIATYGSLASLTYYVVPYEVITKLWILSASLLAAAYPQMTVLRNADLRQLGDRSLSWLLRATTPLAMGAILLAGPGLALWVGEQIADQATPVLQLLAIGVWLNVLAQVPQTVLQATGNADAVGRLQLLELPCYLALVAVLMQAYGIVGVAFAWVLRAALDTVLLVWLTRRRVDGFRAWPLRMQ